MSCPFRDGTTHLVLIPMFGGISGAHFNPAVTLAFLLRGDIALRKALPYWAVQVTGWLVGMLLPYAMLDPYVLQISINTHTRASQWLAETVGAFI